MPIYRGYDIKHIGDQYAVHKNGHRIYELPAHHNSEEGAMAWIDAEKKRQLETSKEGAK